MADKITNGASSSSSFHNQEAPPAPKTTPSTTPSSSSPPPSPGLTPSQLTSFLQNGYLIIPPALPPTTVTALLSETHRLLASFFSPTDDNHNHNHQHPLTRFSTGGKDGKAHVGDDYFLTSGDKIRFFLEEGAFDEEGNLVRDVERAVNKIGHGLHLLSPPFRALSHPPTPDSSQSVKNNDTATAQNGGENHGNDVVVVAPLVSPAAIARTLGFRDPRVLQSMIICKQPEIGGAVPPHQDSTFLFTDPPSALGFWYALEDATLANGCLSFLPGSHRWAPVTERLVRKGGGGGAGTEMVPNTGSRFPADAADAAATAADAAHHDQSDDAYVPGQVKAGDLVLIHGNLLHKSERNTSQKGRIIYTFHIIEADGTVYDERNWLQPPEEGFTRLYT